MSTHPTKLKEYGFELAAFLRFDVEAADEKDARAGAKVFADEAGEDARLTEVEWPEPITEVELAFEDVPELVETRDDEPVRQQCRCDNCIWSGPADETNLVRQLLKRVDPGGALPVGECPKCGALAYLPDENEKVQLRRYAFLDRWMKQHRGYEVEVEAEDLEDRYALITVVFSDGQPDETEFHCYGTLEQCRDELEGHVFQDAPVGYEYGPALLDLDAERELERTTQQRVLFAGEQTP